jgi:hypothetical protein
MEGFPGLSDFHGIGRNPIQQPRVIGLADGIHVCRIQKYFHIKVLITKVGVLEWWRVGVLVVIETEANDKPCNLKMENIT